MEKTSDLKCSMHSKDIENMSARVTKERVRITYCRDALIKV